MAAACSGAQLLLGVFTPKPLGLLGCFVEEAALRLGGWCIPLLFPQYPGLQGPLCSHRWEITSFWWGLGLSCHNSSREIGPLAFCCFLGFSDPATLLPIIAMKMAEMYNRVIIHYSVITDKLYCMTKWASGLTVDAIYLIVRRLQS